MCSFCLFACCCQSLAKRTGKAEDDKLPAAADVREKVLFDSKKKRRKRRHRKLAAEKGGDASAGAKGSRKSERRSSFPSLTVMKMVRQIEVRLRYALNELNNNNDIILIL